MITQSYKYKYTFILRHKHTFTQAHTIRASCIYTTSRNHHHTLYTTTISTTNFDVFMRTCFSYDFVFIYSYYCVFLCLYIVSLVHTFVCY